ncbi:bifunctional glutamate N-acetyltransferase/amino-acid acetyltransferase ArgJ [Syntrophothermus lipocalidus]|uniref:Arginine biosynthesis bifunctional protein ArgJ n=1 Tax=Syntrophothermus lipocalidus (strain DSM 12680 / TGB-C1) TaxID=643648 RepID=D7CJG4_SYNLT|nr:bifunctional glutamate N-acetyltransferase/amino-acid acetyltransferase ArgJ [Syntrophothermus lipocalidus]ADI02919.1 arginine biosynthesis bifunctional protein ArgJ [Syntrophothermus lipocalidus DSM 12680]HOV43384.1 bifunctional glutamate N-acetyltransferase/amino-acid acetyltransferase ArgJ [Syntrophothermus lipocalidus]
MQVITGGVTAPKGFLAQGVMAEIRKKGKKDVAVIYSEGLARAAGVFTTNLVQAACVKYTKQAIADGQAQAIVVNSGNANACTGAHGEKDAYLMAEAAARALKLEPRDVLVASTGVMGVPLPMDRVKAGIERACQGLSREGGLCAAEAIMTTDTVVKETAVEVEIEGRAVRIGGMAKGSGMIHPNMATMLAFITTDANISAECLQKALRDSVDISYNMISVDGDTSTNDMVLVLANGLAGNPEISDEASEAYLAFKEAFNYVNVELAKMIARDGEGATRLIEVQVERAPSQEDARRIARAITASNLIKAAVFGEDANWGRIICAAGYSGADFDPELVDIYLGGVQVARDGAGLEFDEEAAREELRKDAVIIRLDLKQGSYSARAWGCDLTHEYVDINASYRT